MQLTLNYVTLPIKPAATPSRRKSSASSSCFSSHSAGSRPHIQSPLRGIESTFPAIVRRVTLLRNQFTCFGCQVIFIDRTSPGLDVLQRVLCRDILRTTSAIKSIFSGWEMLTYYDTKLHYEAAEVSKLEESRMQLSPF